MTERQAMNYLSSRHSLSSSALNQICAPTDAWRANELGSVRARGWPVEGIANPMAARDCCIPRIEGGRPLPSELSGAIVAIGNFDGFHIGHQAVVGRAVEMARDRGVAAIIATFDPSPMRHFNPDAAPFHLTTLDQRQRLFAKASADAMMVFHFNGDLANVTPKHFVQHWLADAGGVVTGDGFSFGRGRTGTVQVFCELAAAHGIAYEAVNAVSLGDTCVSSTRIRNALKQGDCVTAQMLLSRPFTIYGSLQSCNRITPQLGLSVAFISMNSYLRPPHGSYTVAVRLPDNRVFECVAHINSSTMAASRHGRLWLTGQHLQDDMQGRDVEIEFLARRAAGASN